MDDFWQLHDLLVECQGAFRSCSRWREKSFGPSNLYLSSKRGSAAGIGCLACALAAESESGMPAIGSYQSRGARIRSYQSDVRLAHRTPDYPEYTAGRR